MTLGLVKYSYIWHQNPKQLQKKKYTLDFIKIKNFGGFKGPHQKNEKNNAENGRKYLKIMYVKWDLYPEFMKSSYNLLIKWQ